MYSYLSVPFCTIASPGDFVFEYGVVRDEPHDLLFEFHGSEVSSTSQNLDWSRSRFFLQCFRACVFHCKNHPTLTIPFLRCGVAQTMDTLYLFQQCAQCSLVDELSSLFRKEFFRGNNSRNS